MIRRPRPTARLRLTAIYLAVFVAFGVGLLAINYRLLADQLPAGATSGQLSAISHVGSLTVGNAPTATTQGTATSGTVTAVSTLNHAITDYRANALHRLLVNSSLSLLVCAPLAAIVVWFVARRALRPLHRIVGIARSIDENNLEERIPLSGPRDELYDVSDTINQTLARLEAAFAHERRLLANTSHELRTPIANQRVLLDVTLADPDVSADRLREVCETVRGQTERAERLVEAMLTMASAEQATLATTETDLDDVLASAIDEMDAGSTEVEVAIQPCRIQADRVLCERLVVNLLHNAVRHNAGDPGWIKIELRDDRTGGPILVVSNSAPAISDDELAELTEPFRRGGAARTRSTEGSGLGLAIVEAVARAHGWSVSFDLDQPETFRATVAFSQ